MKRKIICLALALSLAFALCGCGGDGDGDAVRIGRGILYTRTASDEEAFSHLREEQEELDLEDASVPLSGLPTEAAEPETAESEEGWLLVRYVTNENGDVEPVWYRVWTEDGWSGENLPCECEDWRPVISEQK